MERIRARLRRLKQLSKKNLTWANGATLLLNCESVSDDKGRIEALVGVVGEAVHSAVCKRFRVFMHRLRLEEKACSKKGGSPAIEVFYQKKFSAEEVFGDSSLVFLCKSSRVLNVENQLSKTRILNEAKRKENWELRQRIRNMRFEIASLRRNSSRPAHRTTTPSARTELDRMRRELEAANADNTALRERVEVLSGERRVITKEGGRFTVSFHHLVIRLIALGIPDSKIRDVISAVSSFVCVDISDYPSLGTIRNDAIALLGLTMQQAKEVLDSVVGGNDLTLISDETTKRRYKLQTYLVNLARDEGGSKTFCLGIPEVHCKTAAESLEALKGRLNRIELIASGTTTGDLLAEFICSISSAMSDRASTQVLFNKLLEEFKRKILRSVREDWEKMTESERKMLWEVHSLYCQLHIAASITDVVMGVMGEMEGKSGEECTLLWVLKTCASHFSDRGSGKFQQLGRWLNFLNDKGVNKKHCILPSFDGQRFCIAFAIAARVFFLREYLCEYISRFCTECDTLCKARDALTSPLIISQLKTASLIDSFISAPLIRLSEHTQHVCDTTTYVSELISYLRECVNSPSRMFSLTPPQITVGDQSLIFSLDSPYLKGTVDSGYSTEDLKCVSLVSAEMLTYLEVQYSDFLPGGRYHSPSQSLVDKLSNAPSTSRAAERTFGMIDHLFVKSPNCRMIRREGVVMSRMNETIEWLSDKPLSVQAKVVQCALEARKRLEEVSGEERVDLAKKIRESLIEKEEEAKRKEQRVFERQSAIATVIATETGYWRTVVAMDQSLRELRTQGEKIRALTYQLQYRKSTLKQPAPRPGIYIVNPKQAKGEKGEEKIERLRGVLVELISADLTASSGKRVAPDWKGRRVERYVRDFSGMYTLVEGVVEEIEDRDGVLYVRIVYGGHSSDTILLEEFEEELEAKNAKFLGKSGRK